MKHYLDTAEQAARHAGKLLRENFRRQQRVNAAAAHDLKLEIDVQAQELITNLLLKEFPSHAIYGEEGMAGDQSSEHQWVVDPLDGTVNYFYGIPHFCISIGLSKTGVTIEAGLPLFQRMIHRVRKCRLLGSAALDMAYVACGRLDAYIEQGISLWDIAAGWLLIETAGGTVDLRPREDMKDKYSIVASNGVVDLKL